MATTKGIRVYCAGPLFNEKEREEMAQLATALEEAGFQTFLPQRDGLELRKCVKALLEAGIPRQQSADLVAKAVFTLDVYQLLQECAAVVVNLNGRVPDEGAVAEAAMAWSAGKTLVGYKADSRSVFEGADNPLVTGLFDFAVTRSISEAAEKLTALVEDGHIAELRKVEHSSALRQQLRTGSEIWRILQEGRDDARLVAFLRDQCASILV